MSVTPTPAPTPAPASKFSVKTVVADIGKYGVPVVAVLTAVENIPGLGVSGPAQGVIGGIVAIFTAILSVLNQGKVAAAAASGVAK